MSRLQKARDDALWDQLMALANSMQPAIRDAFLLAANAVRSDLVLRQLVRYLADGDIAAAETAVAGELAYQGLRPPLQNALLTAAADTMERASELVGIAFHPDLANPATVQFAQQQSGQLITAITQDQRAGIQQILARGLQAGEGPEAMARDIRLLVGLTSRQQQAVLNYRRALQLGDKNVALGRALRDARSDPKIDRLFSAGQPLDDEAIDKLTARYAQRYLNYRATTIARTESINSLELGRRAAWQQIIDTGTVDVARVRSFWYLGPELNLNAPCPICRPIPAMNRDGVPWGGLFATPDGDIAGPAVHPACRCTVFTRIAN